MKKLLLFITGLLSSLSVLADTTYTLKLNGSKVESKTGYFTTSAGKFSFNTKFVGSYDGTDYTSGLKMEGTTEISFTTNATSTVVVVQAQYNDANHTSENTKTIKFDGTEVALSSGTLDATNAVRIYTFSDLTAGEHKINRGSGESGLFFVSVTEAASTSPIVENITLSSTYALGSTASPLSVDVAMVDEANDYLTYQWYMNSSNTTENGTALSGNGANTSSYTPDVNSVGIIYYYCVITERKTLDDSQVGNPAITNTVAIEVISAVETPVFSEANGTVEIECSTTSAVIYYSVDDGATWIEYTHPFTILDNDVTVLAKAQVGGGALISQIAEHEVIAVKAAPGSSSIVLYFNETDMTQETTDSKALVGKEGTDYEDWKIAFAPNPDNGNYDKTISKSSAGSINGYNVIKGSLGRQVVISMPVGVVANRITLYSYVNSTGATKKNYWSEICEVPYETNSIAMASFTDPANPDVRVFKLNDIEDEITFNDGGDTQKCFYAVVDYTVIAGTTTLNSKGFATISSDKDVIVSGAQAYTCTLEGDVIDAQPIESNIVPAYSGVLLYGEPNDVVTLSYYDGAVEDLGENDLMPTTTKFGLADKVDALVLSGNAFKRFTGDAFDLNKAYLPYGFDVPAKGISIRGIVGEEEEATEVTAVEAENTTNGVMKTAKNGRLVIETAKGVFNMAGARIK